MNYVLRTYIAHWLKNSHKIERLFLETAVEENLITSCFGIVKYKETIAFCNHKVRGIEIPGGHKEIGEHSIQTILREIKEETGLFDLKNIKLLGADKITILEKPDNYRYPHPVSFQMFFYAEAEKLGEIEQGLDSKGVVFLTKNEILGSDIYINYKEFFDLIL